MFSESDQGVQHLAASQRTLPRAGFHVDVCALGRRVYASTGDPDVPPYELALGLCLLRRAGPSLAAGFETGPRTSHR
jgi:hypothetical protein